MRFASPLFLVVLVPIVWAWVILWKKHTARPGLLFSHLALWQGVVRRGEETWLSRVPLICVGLALLCWGVGCARPQMENGVVYSSSQGLDIMLCLDTSGSMRNADIKPTRMEAAKQVCQDFVNKRVGDRIGLVVFGGIALMQCPLTVDHVALNHYIESIAIGMTGVDYTALGDGIAASVARLSELEGTSKVIIALTDGRHNVGEVDPYMAARLAAKFGVRLYTIGVGGNVASAAGEDSLDESCLREIAATASGRYFRASDAQSLAEVYRQIDNLEKRVAVQELLDYQDLAPWLALAGALLLALGLALDNTMCMELP